MYRGNGLRLIPSGLPTVSVTFRSLPVAMLGLIAVLLVAGSSVAVGQVFAFALLLLLPSLVTVPLVRSSASHLGTALGVIRPQRVLVVGAGEAADHVMQRLQRHGLITALGMVDDEPLPGFETVGAIGDIPCHCARKPQVDRIIVALPRVPWLTVSEIIRPLIGVVDIAIVPSNYELMSWRSGTADLAGMPMVPLAPAQHSWMAHAAKRAPRHRAGRFPPDCLCPASPRSEHRHPARFTGARLLSPAPGRRERGSTSVFGSSAPWWRTRRPCGTTSCHRSEADDPRFKMADDPRVTRVGKFLRRYSIDELPQLFNVPGRDHVARRATAFPGEGVRGSLAGARSRPFRHAARHDGSLAGQRSSDLSWDDLCRLDSVYVGSWSVLWGSSHFAADARGRPAAIRCVLSRDGLPAWAAFRSRPNLRRALTA